MIWAKQNINIACRLECQKWLWFEFHGNPSENFYQKKQQKQKKKHEISIHLKHNKTYISQMLKWS